MRSVTRPGTAILFSAALFSWLTALATQLPVVTADVFWIAAAGRELLRTGTVPSTNLFSFTEPGHPWVMHEWLFGPPYERGLETFGPSFFVVLTVLLFLLHVWAILGCTVGRAENVFTGLLAAFVAVAFFNARLLAPRPSSVALLFPVLVVLVAFKPRFSRADFVSVVVIGWVWANAHGSFPLGPLLMLVAAADQATDRRARVLAAAAMACASLLNPYGLGLHALVFGYLAGTDDIYREIHANILEFRNIARAYGATLNGYELAGFTLTAIAALASLRDPRARVRGAFCVLLLASGALHVRHLHLAGIVTCCLLVPWLDRVLTPSSIEPATPRARRLAMAGSLIPAVGVAAALLTACPQAPEAAVLGAAPFLDALRDVPADARVFVSFDDSSLAIWHGFPKGVRVFFDPRNDCYSGQTFRSFNRLGRARDSLAWTELELDRTSTNTVLLPEKHPLAKLLATSRLWTASPGVSGYRLLRRKPQSAGRSAELR